MKMNITGENSLSNTIRIGLQIIFMVGIIVVVSIPVWLKAYCTYININLPYIPALILLFASGIPGLIIVYEFIKIFGTLKNNNPFINENVEHFKVCSICSLVISLEYFIGMFATKALFSIVAIGVFTVAWIGLYILSELLKQAIDYKEENDLTI